MFVAYGKLSLFVGASFDLGKEFGKLLWRGQFSSSRMIGADTSKFQRKLGISAIF